MRLLRLRLLIILWNMTISIGNAGLHYIIFFYLRPYQTLKDADVNVNPADKHKRQRQHQP